MSERLVFHNRAVELENGAVLFSRKGVYDEFEYDYTSEGPQFLWLNFDAKELAILPDGHLLISGSGIIRDAGGVVVPSPGDAILNTDITDSGARLTNI